MLENYLWIEDNKAFIKVTTDTYFRISDLSIDSAYNGEQGIQSLMKKYYDYSLILVDLDMPGMDGIEVYNEIRNINSSIPIVFFTAHDGEPQWERKIKEIENGKEIHRLSKPLPIISSPKYEEEIQNLETLSNEYKAYVTEPFKIKYRKFLKLSEKKKENLFDWADRVNSDFVKLYFDQNRNIDWIIIANEPGNIIRKGKFENEPFEDEIRKIAVKLNSVVFTYSREKIVEENPTPWSKKSQKSDYYPTILLNFKKGKAIKCDFDTGSRRSFISLEELLKTKVLKTRPIMRTSSSIIWGNSYKYYMMRVPCKVVGQKKEQEFLFEFEAVKKWNTTTQGRNYVDRVGLLGRDILLKYKLKILLNGKSKITDIL